MSILSNLKVDARSQLIASLPSDFPDSFFESTTAKSSTVGLAASSRAGGGFTHSEPITGMELVGFSRCGAVGVGGGFPHSRNAIEWLEISEFLQRTANCAQAVAASASAAAAATAEREAHPVGNTGITSIVRGAN